MFGTIPWNNSTLALFMSKCNTPAEMPQAADDANANAEENAALAKMKRTRAAGTCIYEYISHHNQSQLVFNLAT